MIARKSVKIWKYTAMLVRGTISFISSNRPLINGADSLPARTIFTGPARMRLETPSLKTAESAILAGDSHILYFGG